MPPQVRDLQGLIAEQSASLKPQYDIIDQGVAANDASGQAQITGLGAAKDQAFEDITQGGQNRGMLFSGFSPNEQAKYTAGTYLPALAQLQSTIASARSNLLGKKADLGKSAFDAATNIRENDIQFLNNWNKMTAEQKFTASESEKDRAFKAQQAVQQQNFDAGQAAADRAAKASSAAQQGAPAGLISSVSKLLETKKGKDSFVSPETYRSGLQQWVAAGGSPDSYNQTFSGYINPAHQERFGGYL